MTEQLPLDIIMSILKMRPRDSQMKSPTAAGMQRIIARCSHVTWEPFHVVALRWIQNDGEKEEEGESDDE